MELKYGLPKQLISWSEENLALLKPPVANAAVFPDGDYIINVVGGPNFRSDFHDNPTEEIFYQIHGHAHILVWDRGRFERIDLNPGDVFLLPAHLQHSPQRHEKGLCFLVERPRPEDKHDHVRWYCSDCATLIYDGGGQMTDLVADLPAMFDRFYATSDQERTCPQCGKVHPGHKASEWLEALKTSKVANFNQ
ncbi:MAG: 3-hydroxyanthranilate 3,4-dioxygenase [Neisseria sp.]|uniref:3-hydroxyanthranilate 3,4-dioxygenase n=1 Tax=Neisseria sp. TaxID=192066 RepID=UPI0026DDBB98|nr:3-hydroxyanthranilate 3,4-dioxygenase [Neisseria sp.]MDO4249033.1 3-hydroxyanthranilate 3,4-dioxygenase [Neisseria sp.]